MGSEPLTGISGGGGGFDVVDEGVEEEEDDEAREACTRLELGTGRPGRGEAPEKIRFKINERCAMENQWKTNLSEIFQTLRTLS